MPPTPALQILHISDLHLTPNSYSLSGLIKYLATVPKKWSWRPLLEIEDRSITQDLDLHLFRAAIQGVPARIVLTGDIGSWPHDSSSEIDRYHYTFVSNLPYPVLPVLGNHDWGPVWYRPQHWTNFSQTRFQSTYQIVADRCESWRDNHPGIIFFSIDSNIRICPPWGRITDSTLNWLSDKFKDGRADKLGSFTSEEYFRAVKVLLVHHSPLERGAYRRRISRKKYFISQLFGRRDLLDVCANDIDIFLFGHTHVTYCNAIDGFVALNCGTTSAEKTAHGNVFIHLALHSDYLLEVTPYEWKDLRFKPLRPTRFRPGAYRRGAKGYRRWGKVP